MWFQSGCARNQILPGSLNACQDLQKQDQLFMVKFASSVIFLLTAPLTGTHIHPLALSVIPPACCGLLRTPARGILYCAALPAWILKNRGRREEAAAAKAAVRSTEEENRHKTFCKRYGGKNRGANSFVFYANPFRTINYLKKCSSVSFYVNI